MRNMNNLIYYLAFATSNGMYQAHGGAYCENEGNNHTEHEKCAFSMRICRNNVKESLRLYHAA